LISANAGQQSPVRNGLGKARRSFWIVYVCRWEMRYSKV